MEATTLHQIQSFPSHAHGIIQSTAASVSPPPTAQDLSAVQQQYANVPTFFTSTTTSFEDGADKATEASPLCSATQEAKDSNTKDDAKNGDDDGKPDIDIFISNVVCTFSVRCHLNLKRIGMEGRNVEYKREAGKVLMKLRKPYCTATIWSSGKITVTGNSSESDAKMCARRIARQLQKLGFRVHFHQFQVVNVLGTCRLPFAIRIAQFSEGHTQSASYEPEIHPAVTYKIKSPKATLKIFSTGSITVTAPSVENVQHAIHHIYPLVEPHQMERIEKKQPKQPNKNQSEKKDKRKQDIIRVGGGVGGGWVEKVVEVEDDLEEDPLDNDDDEDDVDEEEAMEEEEWESELSDDDL